MSRSTLSPLGYSSCSAVFDHRCAGRGGEDLEALGATVFVGGLGHTVAHRHRTSVALVADDGVLGAEHVAVAQIGAVEQPVIRPPDV